MGKRSMYEYTIREESKGEVVTKGRGHMGELEGILPNEIFAVIRSVDGTDGPLDIRVDTGKTSYEIKKHN
ncbi:hypothetical protein HZY62_21830 [Maribacter polysiphoniae]|uniref:Uncharacterized protein n=1 Tax=Maribacter polysiphoniae TaxID=429344 RepID=A0A316DKK4_9FLAO|nr:hypothetical protein [Maribacter polysiphoniae]MBD1263241.1 hypothetical protein [Maribacter polysiphoniae]PWK17223.1 hypothetical protein LX92_04455 [Maribacter polysiphoniae]|tara:strand:- start:103 stop:312 length:210 start_codon:yes stop_codon:yes gene_type:complete